MSEEDIERILNYTTTMKSGTPYLEIVELIDEYKKQQKEIEDYKTIAENSIEIRENDYISKEKIKEKIKELEQLKRTALNDRVVEMMHDKINILQLLLGEN